MLRQLNTLIDEYRKLQPVSGDVAKVLDQKFRLEFNFNSNHLEGNTLTYGETKLLLLFDQVKSNHEMRELEEMKAHDVALSVIKEESKYRDKPLTEKFIKDLNEVILVQDFWKDAITPDGQTTRRKIKVGQYKEYPNSVIQSNGEIFEYVSPQDTPIQMAELVNWFNVEMYKDEFSPIELASLLHYRYIRIHPFDDGNGRVARLLVNYVLFRYDLPPIIIKTEDKRNYLRSLQQADSGDLQAFIDYMINQLAWSVDLCIKATKGESIDEQNDWEKKLTLLKKQAGQQSKLEIVKSDEVIKILFQNYLITFISLYENKMKQFATLFMDYEFNLYVLDDEDRFEIFSNLEEFLSSSWLSGLAGIGIGSNFNDYRDPYIENVTFPVEFFLEFKTNGFVIKYNNKIITKLYDELFSEEEMNNIINSLANDLIQRIEQMQIENND